MEKTVTVDEALNKGRLKLVYLPLVIIIGFIGAGLLLYKNQFIGEWVLFPSLILGVTCGWLAWSYFANKWKIWAYQNVRNIHELQRKAIEEKLVWRGGSWFEKTEFKSTEQKAKLKSLQQNFLEKDLYKDDINVPKETVIFYSKGILSFLLIISLGMISLGIYSIFEKEYFGSFLIFFGLYLTYEQIKKLRDNEPQIIINDKGIVLKDKKLISWNKIHDDRVFTRSSGKSSKTYLAFNNEMIEVDDLTIRLNQLENLLHVYRVRFENKNI